MAYDASDTSTAGRSPEQKGTRRCVTVFSRTQSRSQSLPSANFALCEIASGRSRDDSGFLDLQRFRH
jgi:hypothetical protein